MHEELIARLRRTRDEIARSAPHTVTVDNDEGRFTSTREQRLDSLDRAIARLEADYDFPAARAAA